MGMNTKRTKSLSLKMRRWVNLPIKTSKSIEILRLVDAKEIDSNFLMQKIEVFPL